jgi:PAS domain S-box-containing protein
MDWLFINRARCRMSGFTEEEIRAKKPFLQTSRETRAMIQGINEAIAAQGFFQAESTLLHKTEQAIPVQLHLKLVTWDGADALLTEFHDITSFKETQKELELSRQSANEMLRLLEEEKLRITDNIQSNLGLVLFPLMDQLRISANEHQKEVLDLMQERIGRMGRDMGLAKRMDPIGHRLTRRQMLICEMIRDGRTSKEIALALDCSPSTVNNHRNIIRKKLNLDGKGVNLHAYLNRAAGPGQDEGTR